jgi:hypothetical protein
LNKKLVRSSTSIYTRQRRKAVNLSVPACEGKHGSDVKKLENKSVCLSIFTEKEETEETWTAPPAPTPPYVARRSFTIV